MNQHRCQVKLHYLHVLFLGDKTEHKRILLECLELILLVTD